MSLMFAALLATAQVDTSFEEKKLATLPEGIEPERIEVSANGRIAAAHFKRNGKEIVAVNGQEGEPFDFIFDLAMNPKGRVSYVGGNRLDEDRTAYFAVIDGKKSEVFDLISCLVVNPAGDDFAFIATEAKKSFVVHNGTRGISYDWVNDLRFTPDGKRPAYAANNGGHRAGGFLPGTSPYWAGGEWYNVEGERRSKVDPDCYIGELTFKADGTSVCLIKRDDMWRIVIGEMEGERFDEIRNVKMNPRGTHLAYTALEDDGWHVIVDQTKCEHGFEWEPRPEFSGDGDVVGYYAKGEDDNFYVVVGDKVSEPYDQVWGPVLNHDGSVAAYIGEKDDQSFLFISDRKLGPFDAALYPRMGSSGEIVACKVKKDGRWFIVTGEQTFGPYEFASEPGVSADGKHLAFGFREQDKWQMWIGGRTEGALEVVWLPEFGSDNRTVAYVAKVKNQKCLVINGRQSDTFDEMGGLGFSPNGKTAYAWARTAGKRALVVGNTCVTGVDEFLTDLAFSADGSKVAFGARIGRELWWKVTRVE